jgi:hypothetical protein
MSKEAVDLPNKIPFLYYAYHMHVILSNMYRVQIVCIP